MGTSLDVDDDVVAAARELAADDSRLLGSVMSELARRGLAPARVEADGELPVIPVPPGTPPSPQRSFAAHSKKAGGLLDVNALVAVAWTRTYTTRQPASGSRQTAATAGPPAPDRNWLRPCLIQSNGLAEHDRRRGCPPRIGVAPRDRQASLSGRRRVDPDNDVPSLIGHRQVGDAHLLTIARRHGVRVVTFDGGVRALGGPDVDLLTAL